MRRSIFLVGGSVAVGVLLVGPAVASGQGTGGQIRVWGVANPNSSNKPSPVVITGAIADYGTTQSVNSSGKPDESGNFVELTLKKGSFRVDTSQLNAKFASAQPSDFNPTNCSGSISVGPVDIPVVKGKGTGSYKGITGSIQMTGEVALILPKNKSGSCNTSNSANPVSGWGVVTGNGSVSFS